MPLGVAGDTSKAPPKPKPTEKTRFSDEAGKKNTQAPGTEGNGAVGAPAAENQTGRQPAVQTQPYSEPSPEKAPGTNPPVNTQTTPTGTGDPLGPTTPPATNQAQPPQR